VTAWIQAFRPKTLPAAVVPVWMGNLPLLEAAGRESNAASFSWLLLASTLASCLCIQIATNLFNDAIDAGKGADTAQRLGPVRATASGLLPARAVMLGGVAFCLLAMVTALPLILSRGWIIVAIGALSLLLAYAYTGGPFPLAYHGLGELFVVLFFGLVAVQGSHFAQSGRFGDTAVWLTALQVGSYSSVLIAINNLRDRAEDAASAKRTLAVRFGPGFARREIAGFSLAPALVALVGMPTAGWRWGLGAVLILPLSLVIVQGVFRSKPGRELNRYLASSGIQLLAFALVSTCLRLVP